MNITQLVALGNHIRANTDATVVQAVAEDNYGVIADWYNQEATPEVTCWKNSVPIVPDVIEAIDWAKYVEVPILGNANTGGIKLATEQQTRFMRQNTALSAIFRLETIDPSKQKVRDIFTEVFDHQATVTALLTISKEPATWAESLFVGDVVQTARVRQFVGEVNAHPDIDKALELTA